MRPSIRTILAFYLCSLLVLVCLAHYHSTPFQKGEKNRMLEIANDHLKVIDRTIIYQNITQDTTWTKDGSPYEVIRNIHIKAGAILTIEQGAVIEFYPHAAMCFSSANPGRIYACGRPNERITFINKNNEENYNKTFIWGVTCFEDRKLLFEY